MTMAFICVLVWILLDLFIVMRDKKFQTVIQKRYKFAGFIDTGGYLRTHDCNLYITKRDLKKHGFGACKIYDDLTLEVIFKDGKTFKGRSKFYISQRIATRVKNIAELKIIS